MLKRWLSEMLGQHPDKALTSSDRHLVAANVSKHLAACELGEATVWS
ncbi:hypothetical protein [Streptomyces sp. NPDC021212]